MKHIFQYKIGPVTLTRAGVIWALDIFNIRIAKIGHMFRVMKNEGWGGTRIEGFGG